MSVYAARVGKSGPLTIVVVNKATTALRTAVKLKHARGARQRQGLAVRRRRASASSARVRVRHHAVRLTAPGQLGHPDPGTAALVTRAVDRSVDLHVTGRVQGVSFRWYAAREATRLEPGRLGPQRARRFGPCAHAEGPDDEVDEFVAWCRQGPPAARVEDVAVTGVEPTGATSFDITA